MHFDVFYLRLHDARSVLNVAIFLKTALRQHFQYLLFCTLICFYSLNVVDTFDLNLVFVCMFSVSLVLFTF